MSDDDKRPRYSDLNFHCDEESAGELYGWLGICTRESRRDSNGNLVFKRIPNTITCILLCDVSGCHFFVDIVDLDEETRFRVFGRRHSGVK